MSYTHILIADKASLSYTPDSSSGSAKKGNACKHAFATLQHAPMRAQSTSSTGVPDDDTERRMSLIRY